MSDGIVGGRLESLTETQSALDGTADRASDSGVRGVQVTQNMESGLQDITQVLQTEFNALANEFREIAQQTQSRLDATEWSGKRKEQAVAVGAEFEADVRRVLDDSEGYIERFRTQAISAAHECVDAMQAGFGSAMDRANESYRNLGLEAATVRDQLSEIDSASGLSR